MPEERWSDNPEIKKIDPQKLALLEEFLKQSDSKNKDELIPFFIAAYHFLSRLDILNSDSFWFLKSFGEPDNLFSFSVFNIHITIIQVWSSQKNASA